MSDVGFAAWTAAATAIAATRSRKAKADVLQQLFTQLDDTALPVAARFFAGVVFPRHDARTVQVGPALLWRALTGVTGQEPINLRERYVAHGDPGDLAAELLSTRPSHGVTLTAIEAAFAGLAAATGSTARGQLLSETVARLSGEEARWFVKLLFGELRIGLKEAQVEDALAATFGAPLDAVRGANLLRGDIGEVAVLARRGELATAALALFHPLGFMLARPLATAAEIVAAMPASFAVEDKYDGIRAQAHIDHGRVALFSRTLDDITTGYPEVVAALAEFPDGTVLDGELLAVAPDAPERALPFRQLQQRLGRKTPSEALQAEVPVWYVAFDVLAADGTLVIAEPLANRRARLEALPWPVRGARAAPQRLVGDVDAVERAFAAARSAGNEGLVAKDVDSPYLPGRRGGAWIKLKTALAPLDVVVTAVERGHGRRRDVLSDYTFAVRTSESDPTLLDIGKAFSGLTDVEIAALTPRFLALTTEQRSGWHRVRPEVVIEVTFDIVQRSTRHPAGYALRFPRIVRVRDDKGPHEIDTLARVRELAGQTPASE